MNFKRLLSVLAVSATSSSLILDTDTSSLSTLVSQAENKEIFSQLLYSDNAFYDKERNDIGTLDFVEFHSYQRQPYVANGYFGARIPNLGHGFANDTLSSLHDANEETLRNGWPLFNERYAGAFVAGFYNSQESTNGTNFPWLSQYGWDSVISAIPQWTFLSLAMENYTLDPLSSPATWGSITNYVQNLSMETGVVTTQYSWLGKVNVRYAVSANKNDVNVGSVKLIIENASEESITIEVTDLLDFETSRRCTFRNTKHDDDGMSISFSPSGLQDVFGSIYSKVTTAGGALDVDKYSNESNRIQRKMVITISPKEAIVVSKLVGIATTDLDPSAYKSEEDVVSAAKSFVDSKTHEKLSKSNAEAWSRSLKSSLAVEFPDSPLLTLASRASVYHLSANMREKANGLTSALSVSGLSSDSYAGQVFWDTDLWMSIGILPFNPEISKSLLNYRLQTRHQAIENIQSPRPKESFAGAIYPWTSGRFGNCTATGPCFDYEYHISSAVALSAFKLYLSGSIDDTYLEDNIYPLVHDAATLFSTFVEYNETSLKYTTSNLTDPDEFANHVNNAAYTNAAISATMAWIEAISMHLNKTVPQKFSDIRGNVLMPLSMEDPNIVLEYTDMNSSIQVKQADVIMITYPLENELITPEQAVANLEYYAMKQVSTGPAMTYPIFSIVSSALLDTGCSSESYLMKSVQPFLRGPFAQFSEQNNDNYLANEGTHPAFPFLTAHGGFLQLLLSGILGIQYTFEIEEGKIVRYLKFDAHKLSLLPRGVYVSGVQYLNYTLDITLNESEFILENKGLVHEMESSVDNFRVVFSQKKGESETKILAKGERISFKVNSLKKSREDSLTECGLATFANITSGVFGDVVDSTHDGDNSTHWQASNKKKARIFIDLKMEQELSKGLINWGDRPAQEFCIYAEESTQGLFVPQYDQYVSNVSEASRVQINTQRDLNAIGGETVQFIPVYTGKVNVTDAGDLNAGVRLQKIHNVTSFELPEPIRSRYVLIEFEGTHDDSEEGAKVYEISLA